MTEYRTIATPRVMPPPAPKPMRRTFTMADLVADAKASQARQKEAWANHMAVDPDRLSSSGRIGFWSPEANAALQADILNILRKHGPLTVTDILSHLTGRKNRHKVRDMLTEMRRAGKVARQKVKQHVWVVA